MFILCYLLIAFPINIRYLFIYLFYCIVLEQIVLLPATNTLITKTLRLLIKIRKYSNDTKSTKFDVIRIELITLKIDNLIEWQQSAVKSIIVHN